MAYIDYNEHALTNGVLSIPRGREPGVIIYMIGREFPRFKAFNHRLKACKFRARKCIVSLQTHRVDPKPDKKKKKNLIFTYCSPSHSLSLSLSLSLKTVFSFNSSSNASSSSVDGGSSIRFRLDNLGPQPGSRKNRKRKGRGHSAGQGGSCGFGMRGQKSRSGPGVRRGFEGGQTALYRRLPKLRGIAGEQQMDVALCYWLSLLVE
ncbi:hypothetical protein AQUCO_02900044v1 [Aquilegia coerulea]|uniref:Uncharacterized protein n=1 Tax=Aquilegia coerulea TaxID=218851 RepID=A0A2G5D324_AQUCA|nr:hypothetical protein AQUCO_02900044v1 [Aquilegia coerulea]